MVTAHEVVQGTPDLAEAAFYSEKAEPLSPGETGPDN
jgi:hypothetical protein